MNRLKRFSTETLYDLAKGDFEYATVSWVEDVDDVRYMGKPDYSTEYLTFEALEEGTFTLSIPANVNSTYMTSVSYSTDNGETWTTTIVDSTAQTITTPTITQGNKVLWKGVGNVMATSYNNYSNFTSTGNFKVTGNIMSLLYADEFANQLIFPSNSSYNFCSLFINSKIVNAKYLILPATTLTQNCYQKMFYRCTSLTIAPELPATTLVSGCYNSMFYGCTALTIAPELRATTLADNCYAGMFQNCTALTTAPNLPATTLAEGCYGYMFSGCTKLTAAPELPATTLAYGCYSVMFQDCTALTTAPELSATTMVQNCYQKMFYHCTSLITAPELPAITLAKDCYEQMFNGCTKLNCIKAMFTTAPSSTYTNNWVSDVASSGTFVKNSAATWTTTGVNGVPTGWTVQTASE